MSRINALNGALNRHGYPKLVPHKFDLANGSEWFTLCGQLVKRRVAEVERLGSVCADILVNPDLALYILRFVAAYKTTRIGKHYITGAGDLIPPLPARDDVWLDAIAVGREIFRLAKRDAGTVRHVLSVFAMAANLDRQIVLTVDEESHLHFARILISFVQDDLEIDDLQIGLVAFRNKAGVHADLHGLCGQLGLDPKCTPLRIESARNLKADSPTKQAGLEVLRDGRASAVTDQAFFSAMILGAAVQVWRFALPATAAAATRPSVQPVASCPRPTDPTSKLPPATARPGTDQDELLESVQRGSPG
jgi:hypothetical protein